LIIAGTRRRDASGLRTRLSAYLSAFVIAILATTHLAIQPADPARDPAAF
jgi:hypothetical protein